MCPGEQCVSGTYDVKGAEDLLVVLREYARKVDVEIVSAIFRVPRRHACERARAVVECKHQDLDEHNCHKPDRQSVMAVPGEHRYGNDATGEESPDERMCRLDSEQIGAATWHGRKSAALGGAAQSMNVQVSAPSKRRTRTAS